MGNETVVCEQDVQNSSAEASQWLNLNGIDNPITLPVLQILLATRTSVRYAHIGSISGALLCTNCE